MFHSLSYTNWFWAILCSVADRYRFCGAHFGFKWLLNVDANSQKMHIQMCRKEKTKNRQQHVYENSPFLCSKLFFDPIYAIFHVSSRIFSLVLPLNSCFSPSTHFSTRFFCYIIHGIVRLILPTACFPIALCVVVALSLNLNVISRGIKRSIEHFFDEK